MLDLEKIRREWLNPCGPCDFGLVEFGCTCPDGDYRNVILALVDELAEARAELDQAKAEQGRIAQRMAAALEPYVGTYTIRQALAEANPATTAEPASCTCATWREETPFGPQTATGPDATCPVHGEKAEPAAEPKATCGATGPDLPFIACTYPPGHPPIPIDVRGVGMRDMEHGNDREYRTWWNGRTALVHGDALAQQNRMVSAENADIVLDDAEPSASWPRPAARTPTRPARGAHMTTTPNIDKIRDVHAVQGRDGNWNYSPYTRGLFNGLELALSIAEGERAPQYRDEPSRYLCDMPEPQHKRERRGRDALLERLHAEIERRQAGADLPFPIYSDVMSLEEVRQMIRRSEQ